VRATHIQHEFVESAPEQLNAGRLYISMPYATTMHLCCCGCGNEVVLPLKPTAWRITYDGEAVSLSPSVGNWSLPCRSHYWIEDSKIRWSGAWTDEQVEAGRRDTLEQRGVASTKHDEPTPGWLRRLYAVVVRRVG
jgi:hypothetical protein